LGEADYRDGNEPELAAVADVVITTTDELLFSREPLAEEWPDCRILCEPSGGNDLLTTIQIASDLLRRDPGNVVVTQRVGKGLEVDCRGVEP
jgi:hypothetical protein